MSTFKTISPIDGAVYVEEQLHSLEDINTVLEKAALAQSLWQDVSLEEKKECIQKFIDILVSQEDEISKELTYQMGRPISHTPFEIKGFKQRADYLMQIAKDNLESHYPPSIEGFDRYIEKLPLGNVCILSPWNYPFLTSVNVLIPALLAGNSVVLKHSAQTPLVAKRYKDAFTKAGLPKDLFSILYLDHKNTALMLADERVDGVFFTGSVKGGIAVQEAIKDIAQTSIIKTQTVIGGGTTPNKKIPTIVLSLAFKNYKENKIEKLLRAKGVIGRMEKEQYLLDFRAIKENELETLISIIKEIINE